MARCEQLLQRRQSAMMGTLNFISLPLLLPLALLTLAVDPATGYDPSSFRCAYYPDRIDRLVEQEVRTVSVNCSGGTAEPGNGGGSGPPPPVLVLTVWSTDPHIAAVVGFGGARSNVVVNRLDDPQHPESNNESFFEVQGLFLGRTTVQIIYHRFGDIGADENDEVKPVFAENGTDSFPLRRTGVENVAAVSCSDLRNDTGCATVVEEYEVAVVRRERFIDHLFLGLVTLLVIFPNVGMGCKVDLGVVKEVFMKPLPPIIGFCCQYIIMPLVNICNVVII